MKKYNLLELERKSFDENSSFNEFKVIIDLVSACSDKDSSISGFTSNDINNIKENKSSLVKRKIYTRVINILIKTINSINSNRKDPERFLTELIYKKENLTSIFYSSTYENPDYFLMGIINNIKREGNNLLIDKLTKLKIASIYCLSSTIPINKIANLYSNDKYLFIILCLSLLSDLTILTKESSQNRDWILNNLPNELDKIVTLSGLEGFKLVIPEPYFLCSYSTDKNRHKIKESIHNFIRNTKMFIELDELSKNIKEKKIVSSSSKTILVIHEQLYSNHAMYRCYFNILNILSKKHNLIGLCFDKNNIDSKASKLFSAHYVMEGRTTPEKMLSLKNFISNSDIDIIFYLSIGMSLNTIISSSFKLAKKQVATLGHPAPSFSKTIDCVISYEGVNKSEMDPYTKYKLLNRTHPMKLITNITNISKVWNIFKSKDCKKVKIAITAMPMKITYEFIEILHKLSLNYQDSIEFIFHDAGGNELIKNTIEMFLKEKFYSQVCVKSKTNYDEYINSLSKCDLSASPYPFGSHNGFLDCTIAGLIGPCLVRNTFPQNTERHYYKLSEFNSLIASSENEYINIISDLIDYVLKIKDESTYLPSNIKSPNEIINILSSCPKDYEEDILSCF